MANQTLDASIQQPEKGVVLEELKCMRDEAEAKITNKAKKK